MKSCLNAPLRSLALSVVSMTAAANPPSLSVEALVSDVLQRNPRVEALAHARDASQARVRPAGSLDDPILNYALAPDSIGVAGLDAGHIVGIAQPLPWPGKRAARRDAAASQAAATGQTLAQTRRTVAYTARTLFADWYYLQQALAANTAQQQLLLDLQQTSRSQYSSGMGGQQAVLAAQLRQVQRQREALELGAQLAGVVAQINGLREARPTAPLPPPAALPVLGPLPAAAQLQDALTQHPQVAELDARIQAAEVDVRLARLDAWPDLRLTATYLGTLPREENRTQIGLALNLPFGQAKRTDARNAAAARQDELRAHRREVLAQLGAALQHALVEADAATATRRLYADELLPLARQNMQAARAEYSSGDGSVREVIEAENELLEARLGAERAWRDEYQQYARIAWLSGGVWEQKILGENQP